MTATQTPPQPRNGVDVETLFATIGVVRDQPPLAKFQFRSSHEWVSGTHSRGTINGFYGAGELVGIKDFPKVLDYVKRCEDRPASQKAVNIPARG